MICVVVPFYNEEDNIEPLHAQLSGVLKSLNRQYKIIFVDDGSTDNTFRAYKNECVKNLDLYGETHRYIPAMLLWRGYRIGEVKVKHHPRKYGKTKYGMQRLAKGFLDLIVISFWQRFSARPIHVFGGLGLLLCISGTLLGGYMGMERLFFGRGLGG